MKGERAPWYVTLAVVILWIAAAGSLVLMWYTAAGGMR